MSWPQVIYPYLSQWSRQGHSAQQTRGDRHRQKSPASSGLVGCKNKTAERRADRGEHVRVGERDMEWYARRLPVHHIDGLVSTFRYCFYIRPSSSLIDFSSPRTSPPCHQNTPVPPCRMTHRLFRLQPLHVLPLPTPRARLIYPVLPIYLLPTLSFPHTIMSTAPYLLNVSQSHCPRTSIPYPCLAPRI